MMDGITTQYLENAIIELGSFFGVKEPLSEIDVYQLLRNGRIKDAIRLFASQLGLPIDINLIYVPKDYRAQKHNHRFHSENLVKTNEHGYATEGITAQIIIPEALPTYGTSALNNYPITIKVSENCTKYVPTFAMIVAHELTHVLFYSLNHPQKDNGIYTDLNAMMQGLLNIYHKGRKTTHSDRTTNSAFVTTTYGYLSDEQFQFASNRINKLLEKAREKKRILAEEINKTSKLIMEYNTKIASFNKNLEYLSKNTGIKISGDDGKKMVMFFQPDYMEKICFPINECRQKQKKVKKYIENLTHYTTITLKNIANFIDVSKKDNEKLKQNICSISKDNKIMEKYTNRFSKIKSWLLNKVFN